MAIADGADSLSKLRVLRDQESLFGPGGLAPQGAAGGGVGAAGRRRRRASAQASASARVWAAGGEPATVTPDFDATLVDATPTGRPGRGPTG